MVSLGIKSSFKEKASLNKLENNSSAGPIRKAITSARPSNETDSSANKDELERNLTENDVQETVKHETELEKKKNLEKLLSRGIATKKDDKAKKEKKDLDDKNPSKDLDKDIEKEWIKNSNAKENDRKSRFDKARDDGLKDQLKNDKDSIVKKYPGLDRAGSRGSPSSEAKNSNPSSSNNTNNSNEGQGFNNGNNFGGGGPQGNSSNSGISKLSNNSQTHYHTQPRNNFNDRGSLTRPDSNFRDRGGGFSRNDFHHNHGNRNVDRVDPGNSGNSLKPYSGLSSLFRDGHIKENVIHASSSEDAQRITAGLRGLGVFNNIEQDGNSIRLSGFNSEKNREIHDAQRNILGQEFLAGRITDFDFEGVNESAVANLTKMLESKAQAIGSTQHSIDSTCDEGVCKVSLGQQTQNITENQQEQYAKNENNQEQTV